MSCQTFGPGVPKQQEHTAAEWLLARPKALALYEVPRPVFADFQLWISGCGLSSDPNRLFVFYCHSGCAKRSWGFHELVSDHRHLHIYQ